MSNESDSWNMHKRGQFEQSRKAFEQREDFAGLISAAAQRGYRRITLAEQLDAGKADAFSWRGGVWVRINEPARESECEYWDGQMCGKDGACYRPSCIPKT